MNAAFRVTAWARSIGFALVLGSVASAAAQGIIYTAPQQPVHYSVFYPGTLDFNIDMNGDGTPDFILRSNDPQSSVNNAFLIPLGNNAVVGMNSYAANMNNGETVGSSLDPVYSWSNTKLPISAVAILLDPEPVEAGNFAGQSSGYIGFDVSYNAAHYYGWMQISSPNNDAAIYGDVVSWAYQSSPNTSIFVGQVPEPNAISLSVLGGLALFLRKRFSR